MLKNHPDQGDIVASANRQLLVRPSQMTPGRILVGVIAVTVMVSALLAANYVTTDYGFIPVGFGLEATAGTFFAGFALASRDAIQDAWGRLAVIVVILVGTVVSFAVALPAIAFASAAAYLCAEALDFAIYSPLRARARLGDRRWAVAVVASNVVGAVTDTVVFLGIAFGTAAITPALPGQMVGKMYATVMYLLIGWTVARLITRQRGKTRLTGWWGPQAR